MENTVAELLILMVIFYRVYVLNGFKVESASDKMFVLYFLKNHQPVIGYIVIFYIAIVVMIEFVVVGKVDIALIILVVLETILKYKNYFIPFKTTNEDAYINEFIKNTFSSLSRDEYLKIKEQLDKPAPVWKLYMTEMMVFLFAVWNLELTSSLN